MFRCPACLTELSVDARCCFYCGFNITNARLAIVPQHQESIQATSKAVQHWRKSWVHRQQTEGYPVLRVSRGQATVTEPLLAMRHTPLPISIGEKRYDTRQDILFWLILLVFLCLMIGLCAYILSTYLP